VQYLAVGITFNVAGVYYAKIFREEEKQEFSNPEQEGPS
jgi:hypothetical protein